MEDLPLILLVPVLHNHAERILLKFDHLPALNNQVRTLSGVRWSQTHKAWHIPLNETSYKQALEKLKPLATVDIKELSLYLHQRKALQATIPKNEREPAPDKSGDLRTHTANPIAHTAGKLSQVNLAAMQKLVEHLQLKAYSASTIRTYRGEMQIFLLALGKHFADSLSTDDVKRYLLKCIQEGLSENTIHSRMNALKFYYEQVLGKEKFFIEIPRPKKPLQLPAFFNQDEIAGIINSIKNLKHKTMLMLAYSSGLRVSEVVAMQTKNIDSKRMCILIQRAKGKKDRMVPLSPVLLIMLREYWTAYKPNNKGYLFAGQNPGEPYSTRSLQLVIEAAKKKAGILKPGSIHALRHSFATHLLDKGTDVTMIMKLLGHNDLKTTLRYLHVTNRDMLQIISPLDDLKLG